MTKDEHKKAAAECKAKADAFLALAQADEDAYQAAKAEYWAQYSFVEAAPAAPTRTGRADKYMKQARALQIRADFHKGRT